jgi:hypothetical protein
MITLTAIVAALALGAGILKLWAALQATAPSERSRAILDAE